MRQFSKILRPGLNLAALLVVGSGLVQAAPIPQIVRFAGSVEVTETTLDFLDATGGYLTGSALDGSGRVVALSGNTGIFAALTQGSEGTIVDRTVTAMGSTPAQPAGPPGVNVIDWLKFDSFGYAFDLKFINIGTYTSTIPACFEPPIAADGDQCTPPAPFPFESPYNLSNYTDSTFGLSSNTSFSVRGDVRNIATGVVEYKFNGGFAAIFLGQSYQSVFADVLAGESVVPSYVGTLAVTAAAIPEPSTAALTVMGVAFVGLGVLRRRRRS